MKWSSFFVLLPLLAVVLAVPLALAEAPPVVHGLASLPGDVQVPHKLLPPGSSESGPSDVFFPPQQLVLRLNLSKHMRKVVGATFKTCHAAAYKSRSVTDTLIPSGEVCDACHSTDHANLDKVQATAYQST
jgi:hypothetical protein